MGLGRGPNNNKNNNIVVCRPQWPAVKSRETKKGDTSFSSPPPVLELPDFFSAPQPDQLSLQPKNSLGGIFISPLSFFAFCRRRRPPFRLIHSISFCSLLLVHISTFVFHFVSFRGSCKKEIWGKIPEWLGTKVAGHEIWLLLRRRQMAEMRQQPPPSFQTFYRRHLRQSWVALITTTRFGPSISCSLVVSILQCPDSLR